MFFLCNDEEKYKLGSTDFHFKKIPTSSSLTHLNKKSIPLKLLNYSIIKANSESNVNKFRQKL